VAGMSRQPAAIVDEQYRVVAEVQAEPHCGKDFCDLCGDCLHCYPDDPCYSSSHGGHQWTIYAEQIVKFRAEHPEAA
jgi:hypothetical protein